MRHWRIAAWLMLLSSSSLTAQVVEVGGSLGVACAGTDGSGCNDNGLVTGGPYGSVLFGDRLEVGGRMVYLTLDDRNGFTVYPVALEFVETDRRRLYVQGLATYHFRPGTRVRPMLGAGLGAARRSQTIQCQDGACAGLAQVGLESGSTHFWNTDRSVLAGVTFLPAPSLPIRAGWWWHSPFNDGFALSEVFLSVGYRFGAR